MENKDSDQEKPPVDLFLVVAQALLVGLGFATVVFAPLTVILSYVRLPDPWSKISVVVGAVCALWFFGLPMPWVVLLFVHSLVLADLVYQKRSLGFLFLSSVTVGTFSGLALVGVYAFRQGKNLLVYWRESIEKAVLLVKSSVNTANQASVDWDALQSVLFSEGPFLYLSVLFLSLWLSLGAASHFGVFGSQGTYSPGRLRRFRLPRWSAILFLFLFIGGALGWLNELSGLTRLFSCLVFVQGCVFLSRVMKEKRIGSRVRTLLWAVSMVFGFYAVLALGVVAALAQPRSRPTLRRNTLGEAAEGTLA